MSELPAFPEPPIPDPLTPAEQRARRLLRLAIIKRSQELNYLPTQLPPPPASPLAPAGKLFALEQLRRVPLTMSPDGQDALTRSTREGRLFPLALQEIFGQHEPVDHLTLTLDRKGRHFPDHPTPDDLVLTLTVYERDDPTDPIARYHINLSDTQHLHPTTRQPLFSALAMARELFRLYLDSRAASLQ